MKFSCDVRVKAELWTICPRCNKEIKLMVDSFGNNAQATVNCASCGFYLSAREQGADGKPSGFFRCIPVSEG